jgi:23S rRNA pseudouridine955/2504/2580 synthase
MVKSASPAVSAVRHVEIGAAQAGQRLDNFLIRILKGVPRTRIYRLLRRGEVRVNRGRARPDYRLAEGDVVRIPPLRTGASETRLVSGEGFGWLTERILYEDEDLLVLDKPAGLAVHGGSGVSVGLIEALRALRPSAPMLELAHRLDRDTSGCLLVAKSRPALTELHRMLRDGEVHKHYLALLQGAWQGGAREVVAALERGRHVSGERRVRVGEEGKTSVSRFAPRQRYADTTLVEIELLTGRTHQARVHAAHLGHPIAGDEKYGDRDFNREMRKRGLKRLFLHAARLHLQHPITGLKLELSSPLPAELEGCLGQMSDETHV